MILFYWIILAFISAYRETEILIERGSWSPEVTWILFWENLFGIKNTDSFHFMWGLWWFLITALIVMEGLWFYLYGKLFIQLHLFIIGREWYWVALSAILNIIIYWQLYMWMRNVAMHIVFMKKDHRRWEYISPVNIK
jgi:hypothetical protein